MAKRAMRASQILFVATAEFRIAGAPTSSGYEPSGRAMLTGYPSPSTQVTSAEIAFYGDMAKLRPASYDDATKKITGFLHLLQLPALQSMFSEAGRSNRVLTLQLQSSGYIDFELNARS